MAISGIANTASSGSIAMSARRLVEEMGSGSRKARGALGRWRVEERVKVLRRQG